jgi:hypothetical protein
LDRASAGTLYIRKASPWEDGYAEGLSDKLPEELLSRHKPIAGS